MVRGKRAGSCDFPMAQELQFISLFSLEPLSQ